MTQKPTRRFLTVVGNILLVIATSLSVPLWPTIPASATVASPVSLGSTPAPSGTIINSPWLVDSAGTEWTYGTTNTSMGALISRNRASGQFTTRAIAAGDEGAISGLYSPLNNLAIFSTRRTGAGNRILAFDTASGTQISSRQLAADETVVRALALNNNADSYIVGTNQNPAKVMKFSTATGALEYSTTLATGLKEITAFIPVGLELLAAVNTNPVKLVSVSRNKLVIGSVFTLAAGTPTLLDPFVVGNVAYFGTDASPGRITAIDISTRTVIGSASLNAGENGARNLVVDESTGTLYATTESSSGPRIASFRLTDLRRLGTTQLSTGSSVTSLLLYGRTLVAGFGGNRGIETLTVAPEPSAPAITSVRESNSSLTVTWSAGSSDEPIRDFTASAAAGSSSASCTTSGTTCTINGLNNGTLYAISVVARSAAGVSQAATSSGMPHTVPDAPHIPRVVRGNTDVTVEWLPRGDGGKPITGYRAVASPSGRLCESVATTCVITGLINGISQTIRVVALNSVGQSLPSEPSPSVTPASAPLAPQILSTNRSNSGATITWVSPTDDGGDAVVSYRVRVMRGTSIVAEVTTSNTTIELDGLTNGTRYDVAVSATNGVGTGFASASAQVTPATVPDAPASVIAVRQPAGADVSWSASPNNGGDPIVAYRIHIHHGDGHITSYEAPESPLTVRGLTNGSTYQVTVSSVNSVGESADSEFATVTPATVPDPPLEVMAHRRNEGADVWWSAPPNDGGDPIAMYRVRVWRGGAVVTQRDTSANYMSIPGLANGTNYRITVAAINSVGESIESAPALVTPATIPGAPASVSAARQSRSADITWSTPANDGGDSITVYRVVVRHGDNQPTSFDATGSPFTLGGLENGVPYSVNVTAVNSVGESLASESVEVTPATTPDPPRSLIAVATDGGANLEWYPPATDGGDLIAHYRVRVWHEATVVVEFDASAPSASVSGLINGVDYRATVTALNNVGESNTSEPAFLTPVAPPVVEPPVVEPPIVEPPIVEPPIVEPPIVEPPTTYRRPSSPVDIAVISATRKMVTVGWAVHDSGGAPVLDYVVHTSRYKNKGFTISPDATSSIARAELRKPRRGVLYVRVIAVTSAGESDPSPAKRVVR